MSARTGFWRRLRRRPDRGDAFMMGYLVVMALLFRWSVELGILFLIGTVGLASERRTTKLERRVDDLERRQS